MKITNVETFSVKPHWLFIKLSTDTGLIGWGEASAASHAPTIAALAEGYGAMLAPPFVVREGLVDLPTSPGLGIDVQEDILRERRLDPADEGPRAVPADDFNG